MKEGRKKIEEKIEKNPLHSIILPKRTPLYYETNCK